MPGVKLGFYWWYLVFPEARGSESGSGESGPTPSCHPSAKRQLEDTTSHVPYLLTHGRMMAKAVPLLLLPFLLIGSQEQVFQMKYEEGQTLTVYCSYKLQRVETRWKTWCKLQENGRLCDHLITRTPVFLGQLSDARVSLLDDTSTATITITMSNLTVEDSGIYWCGIYDSANNTIDILKKIRLEVAPGRPHSSIFSNSLALQALCGLLVTKGLVFTALLVLLCRCRGPEKGRNHSELSQ
ncbi:triggering receptor expressed on myeloid cells 3-like [Notamacropus eugenii]|uniref:triggering receptor expressed on myeloid cells 3-like n=1 Tax=Notamacropus eugenii TaxID=9315 RepID=UPI003B6707AD